MWGKQAHKQLLFPMLVPAIGISYQETLKRSEVNFCFQEERRRRKEVPYLTIPSASTTQTRTATRHFMMPPVHTERVHLTLEWSRSYIQGFRCLLGRSLSKSHSYQSRRGDPHCPFFRLHTLRLPQRYTVSTHCSCDSSTQQTHSKPLRKNTVYNDNMIRYYSARGKFGSCFVLLLFKNKTK